MTTHVNYTYRGEHLVMSIPVKSPCFIPEIIIIMYVNYNSIKKKKDFPFPRLDLVGADIKWQNTN